MHEQLESQARYLAYRWWRMKEPAASHAEGWQYALAHWANFLFEAKRQFNLEEEELGLLDDRGLWSIPGASFGLAT